MMQDMTKVESFVEGIREIYRNAATGGSDTFGFEVLKKRIRVYRCYHGDDTQRSVYCFIDQATGDVLKAAGWSAPAKHARGNLFDAHNGLYAMGPYGPAYLR